jgi:mRNA interferase MazF
MHKSFTTSGIAFPKTQMARSAAGDVCVLNWRGDGLPKEANKIRPCVIVEDTDLFAEEHPNVIVVPLTTNASTIISQLAVTIAPTRENGLERTSFAPAYMVTAASKQRLQGEPFGRITRAQLHSIRAYIAESLGIT